MNRFSFLTGKWGPLIFFGTTVVLGLILLAIASFIPTPPTFTPTPDAKATMAAVRETVAVEATAWVLATPCPKPEGPFYDQGLGRSYVPLWDYWEGRGVTVTSRGASFQFSLGTQGGVLVAPMGTGSTFTTAVSFWNADPNEGLVQIFRLAAQNEDAGQILVYFCPDGVGQYLSDVIYFP